jgi:hemoglobin-like flavoprotein
MLTDPHKAVIRETWRLVEPIADTAADLFYRRLFELKPVYQALFPDDMAAQKRKFIAMLRFIVKSLDWPDSAWRENVDEDSDLFLVVLALGRRHTELYKIPDEAYVTVTEALLWTFDYAMGKKFDKDSRAVWTLVLQLISSTMKMGRLSVVKDGAAVKGSQARNSTATAES